MVRGLMSDEAWRFFEPFVIARTGAQWRDLHDYFGKWQTVYRQFRRWTLAGVWQVLLWTPSTRAARCPTVSR